MFKPRSPTRSEIDQLLDLFLDRSNLIYIHVYREESLYRKPLSEERRSAPRSAPRSRWAPRSEQIQDIYTDIERRAPAETHGLCQRRMDRLFSVRVSIHMICSVCYALQL